jgi:hypothetical protein
LNRRLQMRRRLVAAPGAETPTPNCFGTRAWRARVAWTALRAAGAMRTAAAAPRSHGEFSPAAGTLADRNGTRARKWRVRCFLATWAAAVGLVTLVAGAVVTGAQRDAERAAAPAGALRQHP